MIKIKSAQWTDDQRSTARVVTEDGGEMFVPDDPRNGERQALDAWVAAGGTIEDAPKEK